MYDFIKAVTDHARRPEIKVIFTDGREAVYTYSILDDLMTAAEVEWIIDAATGEVIKGGTIKC